jgi:hypothetical protein
MQPEYKDALFIPQDYRANFKQIIAKRSDAVGFAGGRMAPSLAGQSFYAGQVVGYASTGGDAGYYKPYLSTATDGSQVAVGVIAESMSIDAAGNGSKVTLIVATGAGALFKSRLVGYDAAAKTALGAKEYVEGGETLVIF